MDFRRAAGAEHIEGGAGFILAAHAPAAARLGIEEDERSITRCGHGLRSPFGEEDDAELRAEGRRLLDQAASGQGLVVRMRREGRAGDPKRGGGGNSA